MSRSVLDLFAFYSLGWSRSQNEVSVMLDSLRLDYSRSECLVEGYAPMAPAGADGTLVNRSLCPADDQEVVRQMAYVLRSWPGARGRRRGDDALARLTAERLVDYLHLSGFELMKRPVVTDTGYVGGDR
jgi:hypothetical protein